MYGVRSKSTYTPDEAILSPLPVFHHKQPEPNHLSRGSSVCTSLGVMKLEFTY